MIRRTLILLLMLLALPLQAVSEQAVENLGSSEAREVIVRLQKLLRSDTNIARYTMTVKTPDWTRSITMDSWDDRPGKQFFIRVLAPKKDRGVSYLKQGNNLWMYMPKLERDIRIPPSMMLSSWMGSDFTNDDLVKSSSVIDDYTHRLINRDGKLLTIESIPKEDAPVVWGKLVHVVHSDGIPISEVFYDEDGEKVRTLEFSDVREVAGRTIPTSWVMLPADEPGKSTELRIDSIEFDPPITDTVFTRANLKRSR